MRAKLGWFGIGVCFAWAGVALAQTVFASIRVNGAAIFRGTISDDTGNVTIGDALDVTGAIVGSAAISGTDMTASGDLEIGDELTLAGDAGMAGDVLTSNGMGMAPTWQAGGGGSPAGNDTEIQFNNMGAFGASSRLVFAASGNNGALTVGNANNGVASITVGQNDTGGGNALISAGDVASGNGRGLLVQGSNAVTSGSGGALVLRGGQGAGGGSGGSVNISCPNDGCAIDLQASAAGAGVLRAFAGGTQRLTLTGSASASTGVQFNGYGAGTLTTDASGNITATSDERLKTAIRPFSPGLKAVTELDPITFAWREETGLDTAHRYAGFSAQDVEAAIPEAVGITADEMRTLNDRAILAALVNSIKELNARIAELEATP